MTRHTKSREKYVRKCKKIPRAKNKRPQDFFLLHGEDGLLVHEVNVFFSFSLVSFLYMGRLPENITLFGQEITPETQWVVL